jgi:hypothetical protein
MARHDDTAAETLRLGIKRAQCGTRIGIEQRASQANAMLVELALDTRPVEGGRDVIHRPSFRLTKRRYCHVPRPSPILLAMKKRVGSGSRHPVSAWQEAGGAIAAIRKNSRLTFP